jgi:hypothetical protein
MQQYVVITISKMVRPASKSCFRISLELVISIPPLEYEFAPTSSSPCPLINGNLAALIHSFDASTYPYPRAVAVISLATGAVLDFAMGSCKGKGTGEEDLLRQLMDQFQVGDIALGDGLYGSYFVIATLIRHGVDVVFPIHSGREVDFRVGKRLGKKGHLVKWHKPIRPRWMDKQTYQDFPDGMFIREMQIQFKRDGFRVTRKTVVTTFLAEKKVKRHDIEYLAAERWKIEVDLRAIKQIMKMEILRGRTPKMVQKEVWAHLLAYNLIRKVMAQAASLHGKKPREISFKYALQIVGVFKQRSLFLEDKKDLYLILLATIASKTIVPRPGRFEPRRIKRCQQKYLKLRKPRQVYLRQTRALS